MVGGLFDKHSAYTEENKHSVSLKEHEEIGGDSGGPLVVYKNNEAVHIGISIVTLGGCDSPYPNGFKRVRAYLDYISHETGIQIRD